MISSAFILLIVVTLSCTFLITDAFLPGSVRMRPEIGLNVKKSATSGGSTPKSSKATAAVKPATEKAPATIDLANKKVLSKSDVVALITQRTQFHKDDVSQVISTFADIIREEVFDNGKDVRLVGLGSFKLRTRGARKARNVRTGEAIDVPAKKSLSFSPASSFKAEL